jgi:excisionase family DNA binding protein
MQEKTNTTTLTRPLTPIQAAEYLGFDVKTVTRWARQGYLPGHPLGEGKRKFWRFLESELSDWLSAKTNQLEAA